jgi:O-antigen/teichoic acid export membrane protein
LDDVRPLLRFGVKFQGIVVIGFVRDQGLNVAVAAIAGISTLGVWNLAWRVLQIPYMVFTTLGRIAYPVMARLLGGGHDPRPLIERGSAVLSVVTGALMVGLTGFAPALPVLLGPGWSSVPAVLLWSGIAMIATAPIFLTSGGYLFAIDAGGTWLRTLALGAVTWLAVAMALLGELGAPAVGVGWCAAAVVQLVFLAPRLAKRSGVPVGARLAPPTVAAIAAAASGWVVADAAGGSIGAGLLGLAFGELLLFALLATLARGALRDARVVLRDAVGAARRGAKASARVPAAPGPAHAPSRSS